MIEQTPERRRFCDRSRSLIAGAVAVVVATCPSQMGLAQDTAPNSSKLAIQFIKKYCVDCHGTEEPEGERDLASFKLPLKTVPQFITADEIIDQVTLKRMPPEDAAKIVGVLCLQF